MHRKASMLILLYIISLAIIPNNTLTDVNVLNIKSSTSELLNECSIEAIIKLFSLDKHVIINYDGYSKFLFSRLEVLGYRFTTSFQSNISNFRIMSNYIIISDRLSYLYEMFLKSRNKNFSRLLIITRISNHLLEIVAKNIIKHGLVYIAFLVLKSDKKIVQIYQYNSDCSNCQIEKLSLIWHCDFSLTPEIKINGEIRPLGDNLCPVNSCKMRFIRVDYGAANEELLGIESDDTLTRYDSHGACILQAFADFHNIEVIHADFVSNYNWSTAVYEMDTKFVDVCFGPTLPSEYLVTHLDKGSAYTFEAFVFIDTIPKSIPTIFALIMPLQTEVWIYVIVVVIVFSVFIKIQNYCRTKRHVNDKLYFLHLAALFFNQSIRLPKNTGLRMIISLWLIYVFLINTIYNSNFVSDVINRPPANLLKTFDELRTSNRKFGGPDIVREWLFDPEDSTMIDLHERYQIVDPNNLTYALYNLTMIIAQTDYLIFKTNMANIYILKEHIVSYPLLYYTPKGHPYVKYISKFMENIRAGQISFRGCLEKKMKLQDNQSGTIRMVQLNIVFKALLVCHALSAILYVIECLVNKLPKTVAYKVLISSIMYKLDV